MVTPDVYLLFHDRGGWVQRALRAKVALMDGLGDCIRNLVGFVGKPVLDARAWAVQQVFMKEMM